MDYIKEIWGGSLPNLGYVIDADDGGQYIVVLGGQSIPKGDTKYIREAISRRNAQMQQLYNQEALSEEHKKDLAQLMKKMLSICECREEGLYTQKEQASFIDNLSENEKKQLAHQIQMLKDCRCFYRDYIFRG